MTTQIESLTLAQQVERIVRPNLRFLADGAPIAPQENLGELGLDSLASINLLFDLETEFGVTIPDEVIDENTFSSLSNLESVLKDALNA